MTESTCSLGKNRLELGPRDWSKGRKSPKLVNTFTFLDIRSDPEKVS